MGVQVKIAPYLSLENIVASIGWLVDKYASVRRDRTPPDKRRPEPDPNSLYPIHRRAALPDPSEQVKNSLAVRLTRAAKEALDLLGAWPLCTREQLAGLMGGVTLCRVNQVLRSLRQHELVRVEPNTAMWTVNIQNADPSVVFAGSRYGHLYRSDDGGGSRSKPLREFSEISSAMWLPE